MIYDSKCKEVLQIKKPLHNTQIQIQVGSTDLGYVNLLIPVCVTLSCFADYVCVVDIGLLELAMRLSTDKNKVG